MRRWRMLAAVSVVMALGVAGCGNDGEPDDSAAGESPVSSGASEVDDAEDGSSEEVVSDEDMSDEGMSDDESEAGMSDEPAAGPQFTGTTVDGEPFDASSLAGRPVVLWFWAPWCPVCARQAPAVLSVAEEHEGEVAVVGVAGLAGAEQMPEFIDRTGTGDLTHLSDPDGEIWRLYEVAEQSTYVLLDSSGEPVSSGKFSDDELADRVADLG